MRISGLALMMAIDLLPGGAPMSDASWQTPCQLAGLDVVKEIVSMVYECRPPPEPGECHEEARSVPDFLPFVASPGRPGFGFASLRNERFTELSQQ
jgi:hypothetical protein